MKLAMATVLAGIAVLAVVVLAGITSAGAVEPAFHFFRCEPAPGTGKYQFGCFRKAPPPDYNRTYVGSTPETIKTVNTSSFELETTVSGIAVLITCTAETGTGTGKNPEPFESTNGEGEATLTFEGCVASKPGGACTIPSKKIVTSSLHEAIEESKTLGVGIKFTPASGTTFATIVFSAECALGKVIVKGSDFGIVNEEGELEFTNASSSLTVGTKEAMLRGKLKEENEKGGVVSVG